MAAGGSVFGEGAVAGERLKEEGEKPGDCESSFFKKEKAES
jgi:hypothetical protein